MKKGYKALLDEADAEIEALTPAEAAPRLLQGVIHAAGNRIARGGHLE